MREWPREYLDAALAGRPNEHDAVVAYSPGRAELLGLASLATPSDAGPGVGELGILVADPWQRQGIGTAMTELLLTRARARGVEGIAASVLPYRSPLLAALTRHLDREAVVRTRDGLTGIFRLAPLTV